jgi:hypothetical protein
MIMVREEAEDDFAYNTGNSFVSGLLLLLSFRKMPGGVYLYSQDSGG